MGSHHFVRPQRTFPRAGDRPTRPDGENSVHAAILQCGPRLATIGAVTVELARHLVRSGVLSAEEVQEALLRAVSGGVPFVKALVDSSPATADLVDQELSRLGVPSLQSVRLARELARDLPTGMCARLLAVPIGRDPDTGVIEIAAVDPLDPHIPEEFAFHLGTPVAAYRAPLSEIEAALDALPFTPSAPPPWSPQEEEYDDRTPAFGSLRLRGPAAPIGRIAPPPETDRYGSAGDDRPSVSPSAPPIPLVRRTIPAGTPEVKSRRARPRLDTFPGVGTSRAVTVGTLGEDESGQPVIGLYRSKAPADSHRFAQPASEPEPTPTPEPQTQRAPPREAAEDIPEETDTLAAALDALPTAATPQDVVDLLVSGASAVAASVLVLSSRGKKLQGRAGRGLLDAQPVQSVTFVRNGSSIFDVAVHDGSYVGPVPDTDVHAGLIVLLGRIEDDVHVAPVLVSEKPALMLLLTGTSSVEAAADSVAPLVRKAGFALERIVLSRKL